MSNIKTKQSFQLLAQKQNQVGQTWEQRKAFFARGGGEVAPARQAPAKHVDQFLRGGKKPETVGHFDPQAMYRKARMHFMGAPFRPSAVDHLHNGTAPLKVGKVSRQWTDDENLRLLNLVIQSPVYADKRSIQKAQRAATTAASPVRQAKSAVPRTAPQQDMTQQQYAQALARRNRVSSR